MTGRMNQQTAADIIRAGMPALNHGDLSDQIAAALDALGLLPTTQPGTEQPLEPDNAKQ